MTEVRETMNLSRHGDMKSISRWQDTSEFANRIVAYVIPRLDRCQHLGGPESGLRLAAYPDIRFGVVSGLDLIERPFTNGEHGHVLTRFIKPAETSAGCALCESHIFGTGLRMRLATNTEVELLRAAVARGDSKPEYGVWNPDGTFTGMATDRVKR